MHKRTIALAAAALLFNGGAIAQVPQKQQPRPQRSASNEGRGEATLKTENAQKPS